MSGERYPENQHPFLADVEQGNQRFAELREEFLLGYGYNTARAYWNDLEDIKDWAEGRRFDVLELTEKQFRQYLTLLKRRSYSPNTLRRRQCTWRLFVRSWQASEAETHKKRVMTKVTLPASAASCNIK